MYVFIRVLKTSPTICCAENVLEQRESFSFLIISLFNYSSAQVENPEKKTVIINAEQRAWLGLFNFLLEFTWDKIRNFFV